VLTGALTSNPLAIVGAMHGFKFYGWCKESLAFACKFEALEKECTRHSPASERPSVPLLSGWECTICAVANGYCASSTDISGVCSTA